MNRLVSRSISALIVGLSICSTAKAHYTPPAIAPVKPAPPVLDCERGIKLALQTRLDRWMAQREQIRILERKDVSVERLTDAYRALVQNLFDTDLVERTRLIRLVLPSGRIMSRIDVTLPAQQFTEELIRLMLQQLSRETVLAKLRDLADLYQDKLEGY